jgi:hypothetical protein
LPLWTTVRRRKDNIKINLTEIAFEYIDWIHLHQDKVWRGEGRVSYEYGNKTSSSRKKTSNFLKS